MLYCGLKQYPRSLCADARDTYSPGSVFNISLLLLLLQVVLADLQDLQSSWEEQDWEEWEQQQQLTDAEAAVVQQLTASTPLMPDDFSR
jgi:beta-lactamase class D